MSSDERWIIVPNWDRFQHYKDRNPNWIKVYNELLHDDDWLTLTDAQRGFLLTVWLEFASAHGQLKASRIPSRMRPVDVARTLERLNHAGWIQLVASKPLAIARSREVEKSREEKAFAHAPVENPAPSKPKRKPKQAEE